MKKHLVPVMAFLALLCSVSGAGAGMIRAYYSGVAVSGTKEKEDLSAGLKALLASRLNGDLIFAVDTPAEADIVIAGSYVGMASVFSVVATATGRDGRELARVSVLGDGRDELIPEVERLAKELSEKVRKNYMPIAVAK
jgi:hypothetical protein